ncbi:AAA family ATPase [Denitrobaculum tricleocarpae]|uniref:AAA family ATPase n=1 Tax=Denitrobaculum tricleocarpae TaxID=2591009 RepID=A0A545U168_9PROT|nr:ATP-binding protein [Denitrobaculum tricleocarpae]TQV83186.1 AAA family ATPase [Denitrobaculum tricleocarpae]
MSVAKNLMEIREQDIRSHYEPAFHLLEGFEHHPRIGTARAGAVTATSPEAAARGGIPARRAFRSTTPGLAARRPARKEGVVLIGRIEAADDGDPLVSATQATVLSSLRRAIATAHAVSDLYDEQTPLGALKRSNRDGSLEAGKKAEFGELLAAASLIVLHVFANMSAFLLAAHSGEAGEHEVQVEDLKEILTDNPALALKGALWELDQVVAEKAKVEADLIPAVAAFMERLMEEVSIRAQSAPGLEAFLAASFRVEADDFQIDGFTPATRARSTSLTMTFKKPHEVVGNHIAKYQSLKLAKMLMAYDFDRRLNPFAELGGFIFTFMGDGKPGTGKTTLIQMIAGLLNDYCQNAGYPFRYENLSSDSIDSYQGKSGQNAKAFIRAVLDPHVIGFGTIDDIDQIAGKRGDRQSSAGQQEVTAVLMESFAGANTVVRGNCTFGMFSNYPENVDDALRQRAGARFLVDGPQTRADYIDILHLLLGSNHNIPVGDHDLFAAQEIKSAVAASYAQHSRPQEEQLANVFDRARDAIGELDTIEKMGAYLKAIQEADERFTGRAIKNITDAVKVRAMDFELPDEWMENSELFLQKDYDTKLAMIRELTRPITPEMVIQEINRYADSEFRYGNASDEAAIDAQVKEMTRMAAARARFAGKEG